MWILPQIEFSWHSGSMSDKHVILNWFWEFLCDGLSSFNPKWFYCTTHMHGLVVYVKEGLPFAQDLSLENFADSYIYFWLTLLHSLSYFFFLYQSPSLSLCMVFDSVSSNIDSISSNINEVFLINPSANVFVFGDFNIHLKDWLTYSSGTDRPGELL